MKAAILSTVRGTPGVFLRFEEVPRPQLEAGHVLLRVVACGVCRTDLHIVEGDLPQVKQQLIPGHQIVGEVIEGATAELPLAVRGRKRVLGDFAQKTHAKSFVSGCGLGEFAQNLTCATGC
jgi:D-arabinose 1-dehydrogenase-like Zn-dependent alcohol dehydrogenase